MDSDALYQQLLQRYGYDSDPRRTEPAQSPPQEPAMTQLPAGPDSWTANPIAQLSAHTPPDAATQPEPAVELRPGTRLRLTITVDAIEVVADGDGDREQEDLSHLDEAHGPLVATEKIGDLDLLIKQPPQDPEWRADGDTL